MIVNLSNHFFLTSSEAVNEIIKPLQDFFGLTSFVYQKNFADGSEIRLSNQPEWIHYFYEKELYQQSLFENHPSRFQKGYLVWASLKAHQPILQQAREFNIDHGITIIEPQEDGCEFFFLGTAVDQTQVMPKYLSNLDLITRFLDYFREKAGPLIIEAEKHKILIPDKFKQAPNVNIPTAIDRRGFLKLLDNHQLSAREQECLQLLLRGYTQKMIAQELNISPRTVETYLNQIKQKAQVYSKAELIRHFSKT